MLIKIILFATMFMSTLCRPRLVEGNDRLPGKLLIALLCCLAIMFCFLSIHSRRNSFLKDKKAAHTLVCIFCYNVFMVNERQVETGDSEYEGNDDTAANDYLHEDQEATIDEAQRINRRHEGGQDFEEQGGFSDVDIADQQSIKNKDRYESFSDISSRSRNERTHDEYKNINNDRGVASKKGHPEIYQQPNDATNEAEVHEIFTQSKNNQLKRTQSESLNKGPFNTAPDYGSEMLFNLKPAQAAGASNKNEMPEEGSDQPNADEQYYMHSRNRDHTGAKKFANIFDRDRRHVENVKERQSADATNPPKNEEEIDTNESTENDIVKSIKKLSEQDLEELLNSLPEDKKILLRKIMDKREITKKAGAVDENSNLEGGQSDTSKSEAGYSVESNTESSLSSNTPEASKQTENGEEVNTKNPNGESGSGTSGSKSEISDTDIKGERSAIGEESERFMEDSINEENKISKTDTKRETQNKESLGDSKNSDYEFYASDPKNSAMNQEDMCSENEAWLESKNEESKENEGQISNFKREISQKDPSALRDCVKSLEDSFPANSNNDNSLQSEMAPLIRVKRTEKDRLKLKDSPVLSNVKVQYSPGDDNYENEENSECDNKGIYDRSINFYDNQDISSKDTLLDMGEIQLNSPVAKLHPAVNSEIQKMKTDKLSLGSDTDSVLSGAEGVDENLMYNSGLRAKRTPKRSNVDLKNSIRIKRTAGPINVGSISDNSISEYEENEAFGPLSSNVEENLNRHKRVRNINISSSQEGSV